MFMSLFVIYGFDTASTLAEETRNPRARGTEGRPRLDRRRVRDRRHLPVGHAARRSRHADGDQGRLRAGERSSRRTSAAFSTVYLLVVSAAIFVCCLSIMTATIRLCFGMARDDQLPVSKALSQGASEAAHADRRRASSIGILAFIPIHPVRRRGDHRGRGDGDDLPQLPARELAVLRARLRGWPKSKAPFSLGRWGMPLNVLGLAWGGGDAGQLRLARAATEPDAAQTAPALNFHWGWLNSGPCSGGSSSSSSSERSTSRSSSATSRAPAELRRTRSRRPPRDGSATGAGEERGERFGPTEEARTGEPNAL